LPYGLNLEILNVKLLRKQISNKLNKEHVTFSLRKKINLFKIKDKFIEKDFSYLNYSIDHATDYIAIKKKLEKYDLKDSWKKIIKYEKK
jgi:spore coat polysaccharide biosynthesis protein SpsF (cytidylyltransferase family)